MLGLNDGAPVARAALWAMPGEAVPSDVVLIDADWEEPGLEGAHELLGRTHDLAATLGATELEHHVDSPPGPPQYQEHDSDRARLLTGSGYELQRDGLRWLFTASAAVALPPESSLVFRGLAEVGEDAFIEAFAATYEGTLDSILARHIEQRGLLGAGRADFTYYQQMEYLPEWWELAYTEDGSLAGVVMGARTPSSAVIGYVGVVPAQRGRGFAAQLVQRGTAQLVAAGAAEIRGDCDRDNVAMIRAFRRAGYQETARRRSFRCRLVS